MACLFIVIYAEIIFLRADFFFAIVLLFKQKFPFGGKVLNLFAIFMKNAPKSI